MEKLKNLINLTVGTEGNLDIPAYWMNKILTSIREKIEDLEKKTSDIPTATCVYDLFNTKQDQEEGKVLSTNDFTNDEKEKLASLENYDDSELANKVSELETRIATLEATIQTLQETSTTSTTDEQES